MRKTVASGLAFGFLFAILVMIWFFRASSHIVFEVDAAKTLGLHFEAIPQVALRPLSLKEIGQRLGIADELEFSKLTDVFARRIASGFLPTKWDRECLDKYHDNFCRGLRDYFEKISEIRPSLKRKFRSRNRVVFNLNKIDRLERGDFGQLLSRMPDWTLAQFVSFSKAALKLNSCPRNFSLALASKIEIHLPNETAWRYMRLLQAHGIQCVSLKDAGAEYNFLRVGLTEYATGNFTAAIDFLEKAKDVTDHRELYRVLYWLSKSYRAVGRIGEADQIAAQLFARYPLAWHTISLKVENKIDPLENFLRLPAYPDKYEASEDIQNLRILWLQALTENDSLPLASKKYGEFVVKGLDPKIDTGLLQYLARVLDRAGYHRLQIIALNRVMILHPEHLSRESLRLLFPKPFYEDLDRHSPHLDTAILLGLARQESGFDPAASSGANAHGLLQLLPSTARSLSRKTKKAELFDYAKNIELGSKFMIQLVRYFDGSVEKALASYNAGQGSVKKWVSRYTFIKDEQLFMDMIPYRETRDYVPNILRNAYWYHRLFPEMTESLSDVVSTSSLLKTRLFPPGGFVKTLSSDVYRKAPIPSPQNETKAEAAQSERDAQSE